MSSRDSASIPTQAAYQVVVSVRPDPEYADEGQSLDRWLLNAIEENHEALERDLTRRAVRRLGPAYTARIGIVGPVGSVRLVVLLTVQYSVRVTAETIGAFRHFVGDIETGIARALEPSVPGVVEAAAELDDSSLPQDPKTLEQKSPEEKTPWDRIAAVLAAVGTGIGVLGFVTFVGGAVVWARFHAAGLPEEQAVSVLPSHDLVVVGAETLVPAVGVGLLACAAYLLFSLLGGAREERIPDPQNRLAVERHPAVVRGVFLAIVVIPFELVVAALLLEHPGPLAIVLVVALGVVMTGLVIVIGSVTDRFVYIASGLFVSLSLYLALVTFIDAYTNAELRGAAVIRDNAKATIGFFVAEGSDRVYLARLDIPELKQDNVEKRTSRLIGIAKDQVTDIEVGGPKTVLVDAVDQAKALAIELCRLEPGAKQAPRSRPPRGLTKADICWPAGPSTVFVPHGP